MDPVSKAQQSPAIRPKTGQPKGFATRFKPGQSGNPSGRPKHTPLTKLYNRILSKKKNIKDIEAAVLRIVLGSRMAAVLQLREMAERVEGKVSQPLEVSGEVNVTLSERLEKARQRKVNGKGT